MRLRTYRAKFIFWLIQTFLKLHIITKEDAERHYMKLLFLEVLER